MHEEKNTNNDDELCQVRTIHFDRVVRAKKQAIGPREAGQMSRVFKVLGDPTRLGIVMALRTEEMCVCDLAAALELSESAISHQLRRLRDLALVKNRREGAVLYYSLDDQHVEKLLQVALDHVQER